jgi:uncharacterized protein YeaO (DUF488 family)
MKIKTSYFSNVKGSDVQNIVSISLGNPKWLNIVNRHSALAPTYVLLKSFQADKINESEYVRQFNKMLSKLNAQDVYSQLLAMTPEPILCCHCSTQHFCHRHLVAEWLCSELGIDIQEHKVGRVNRLQGRIISSAEPQQISLF